ncbi:MAG: hypothetical protein WCD18_03750 [Thermosynechococcaceae cyanobacterium]
MPNGSSPFDRSVVRRKSNQYRFDIGPKEYALFIGSIANGVSIEDSAWAAGLTPQRVHDWLKKGQILFESDAELSPGSAAQQYARFWEDYKKASSGFVIRHVVNINDAAVNGTSGNWTASAWALQRKRPKEFSERYLIDQMTDKKMIELVKFIFDQSPTEVFREQLAAIVQMIPTLRLSETETDVGQF